MRLIATIFISICLSACGGSETPPQPDIVSFVAAAETITAGDAAALTAVFDFGFATVDNGVGAVTSDTPTSVTPTATTTYTLTTSNSASRRVTKSVTVTVVPAPEITSFVSAAGTITAGQAVDLTAVFAAIFADGSASIDNGVGAVTSNTPTSVAPAATTTYTLTATNGAGTAVTSAVTVTVVPAPEITGFESAAGTITAGDAVDLTAVFAGGSASIDNGVGAVTSNTPTSVSPNATTTYTLTATNAIGTAVTSAVTVTVVPAPEITSFVSAAGTITAGQAVDLTAVFAGGAASIDNAVGAVTSNTPASASPASTTTFRLTVTNSLGVTATESVEVIILPTVTAVSPLSGAVGVPRNSVISGTFSEALLGTSIVANSLTLSGATGTVALDASTESVTLTPDSNLKILTTYSATLSEDISNLTGDLMGTDYNWSFRTEDGDWGAAELIETNNAGNTESPQIAIDSSGNAIAVWVQFDGTRNNIWANRFDGTNPGAAELIKADNAGSAINPQIAIDSSGNAVAVWTQWDGTRDSIWANRFNGTSWGTAELIEADNAGNAEYPQIAIDSSGNAIAVWRQYDGAHYSIYANRFDGTSWFNGTSWGMAELIESDNAGNAEQPQIAFDSSGNAIAVWTQWDGTRDSIWANRFNGTSWGTAELIEADNAGNASTPQIAFDSSGNAIVVWDQYDGLRYNIWANRFNGTSWGMAGLIEADNAGNAEYPQIALNSSGNAIAVWQQDDGGRFNIWANRFNGTSWGTAELIEADNAGNAWHPQIAFDSSGNAIAVWTQWDGTRYNIWANRFDGASWGSAELIEAGDAGNAIHPQIAFDSSGNAVAVWTQWDGTRYNVYANRFD